MEARKAFYQSNIQSQLDYCSVIWGASANVDKLIKLQKRAIRIISDKPYRAHSKELADKIDFRILTYVYKALHCLTPQYICNMFSYVNNNRVTRSSVRRDLGLPNRRLKIFRKHLRYNGAKLYDNIVSEIRNSETLRAFKTFYMRNYFTTY